MSSPELSGAAATPRAFADSRFGAQAVLSLRAAFGRSRHPMLIADDQRRFVTANAAACELLGIAPEEVPWLTIDDFTPPSQRGSLEQRWGAFLAGGEAEGRYQLCVPDRGPVPVEFSATANVLPARHLSILISPERADAEQADGEQADRAVGPEMAWRTVVPEEGGRLRLTEREREVMTLVAAGLQNNDIAARLFLSPETIKSHVSHAMSKLDAHTRAHAVAIALVTRQIPWEG